MRTPPTTDRGRATLARVLDAACALFAQQGVRATTLNQIGAAASVGRGQLYHFHDDKSDLVADVVAQQAEGLLSLLRPQLEAMSTAEDVRSWCTTAVALHAAQPSSARCPLGSLAYELGDDEPRARAALVAGFVRWTSLLEEGLRRVGDGGELRPGVNPAELARAVLAAYEGGVLLAGVTGDVDALRLALGAVVEPALAPE